jgi:hypothetical protein
MSTKKTCLDCKKNFGADGEWQKICKQCFAIAKTKGPEQGGLLPDGDSIASALNNIADGLFAVARALMVEHDDNAPFDQEAAQ